MIIIASIEVLFQEGYLRVLEKKKLIGWLPCSLIIVILTVNLMNTFLTKTITVSICSTGITSIYETLQEPIRQIVVLISYLQTK